MGNQRFTGSVKWYNSEKGFGFIVPDGGGADVFVHRTAVERAKMAALSEGQRLEYGEESANNRVRACDLKPV